MNRIIIRITASIALIVLFSVGYAQTGPGGVGTTNGSSALELWLAADSIPGLNNGLRANIWNDISGNGRDADNTNSDDPLIFSVNTPYFIDTVDNSGRTIKAIRFDGVDDWYRNTYSYDAQTVFVVYNFRDDLQNTDDLGQIWGDYDDGVHVAIDTRVANLDGISIDGNGTNTGDYAFNSAVYTAISDDNNSPAITRDQWQILTTEFDTPITLDEQTLGSLRPSFDIATHNLGADVAEIIVFSNALNDAERVAVENYLSTKYNIDISASGNDFFAYDDTFPGNVAGFGRINAEYDTSFFSSSILGFDTTATSFDADGDFLFAGHNSGTTIWGTTELPVDGLGQIQRIRREWRVDDTGVGLVRVLVDTTKLQTPASGFDTYTLLVDDDGDFTNASIYQMERVSATSPYWAVEIDLNDGDFLSVGIIDPVIGFELSGTSDFETVVSPTVDVKTNFIALSDLSIDYETADGDAVAGNDYTAIATTTGTILAGTSSFPIALSITNDSDNESAENFNILLTNGPSGIDIVNSPFTYTIEDDDNPRKIYFDEATTSVNESGGTIQITVNLTPSQADPSNTTFVDFAVTNGTATGGGTDYTIAEGTLSIPPNNIANTFDITITDDAVNELDETIVISLSNPQNGNLSLTEPIQHTVNIQDNDPEPQIQFNTSSSNNNESVTDPSILVVLSSVSARDINVDYSIGGTADGGGDDFTLVGGTATILAGELFTTINPVIVDDASPEEDETIIITLSNPTNASLGGNTLHTYTIINDDGPFGFVGPGGVGGQNSISLWLKADSISGLTDGDPIDTWVDVSGNNHDASQTDDTGYRPTWVESGINGFPVVRFDGTDDYFDDNHTYNAKTVFIVFRISSTLQPNNELAQLWGSYNELVHVAPEPRSGADQFGFSFDGNQSGFGTARYALDGDDYGTLVDDGTYYTWNYDQEYIVTVEYDLSESLTRQTIAGIVDNFAVGQQHLGGDIAEIIVFNQELSQARRDIVENYLGAKYGITLDGGNDFYVNQTTHPYDVAGIGQDENGKAHTDATSNNILRINSATDLDNNEYLFWGHDNGSLTWSGTDVPDDSLQRIGREWVVDITGDIGATTFQIDTSFLPALPTGYQGYVLLSDDDGDFTNGGTSARPLTRNGKYYQVENILYADGEVFTIGTVGITAYFDIASASVDESTATYDITVDFSRALTSDTDLSFSIDGVSTATGPGAAGTDDYDLTTASPITVSAGSTTANISLTLNNDSDVEIDETVIINLDDATANVSVRPNEQFTLTIQDNDAAGAVGNGPGGVPLTDIAFWLKADSIVYETGTTPSADGGVPSADGGVAGIWYDATGNGNDADTTATGNPTYVFNGSQNQNGRPYIQFGNAGMEIADDNEIDGTLTNKSVIVAFRAGSNITDRQVVYGQGGGTQGFNIHIDDGLIRFAIYDTDYTNTGFGDQTGYIEISSAIAANSLVIANIEYRGADQELRAYVNGTLVGTESVLGGEVNLDGHGNAHIGEDGNFDFRDNGAAIPFTGRFYEIISTDADSYFSEAQRIIIENYLSGKWNESLTTNGIFDHASTNSYQIVGIGRASSTDFQVAAASSELLNISNPSSLDDGEYVFVGHNNADSTAFSATNVPNLNIERLPIEWRASVQGDPGQVKLTFDPTETGATPSSADFNQYAILVDADGDFTSGANLFTLFQNGSVYESSSVTLSDGDHIAIAAFKPEIQFLPAVVSGDESDTIVTVNVALNYPVDGDVTVDYALDGTATTASQPADFDLTDATATINSGEQSTSFTFDVVDDADDTEGNETVVIDLSNPLLDGGAGLFIGEDTTYTYTIEDNDQSTKVDWAVTTSTVAENNGSVNITLKLNELAATDVTVNYTITDGTAVSGEDFTLSDGTITITAGDLISSLLIPLINDGNAESDETIEITLSTPTGANLGINTVHTVTITDADPDPEVRFPSASFSGSEGSTPGNLPVTLSLTSGKTITVDYALSGGTATDGVDFNFTAGTLTFEPGDSVLSVSVPIVDDFDLEVDEDIQVTLSGETNATLGLATATYTINDNDASGTTGPGGVRSAGDYLFWLRADKLVYSNLGTNTLASDGATVETWGDFSGNDINPTGVIGSEPSFIDNPSGNVNGKQAILFSGNEEIEFAENLAGIDLGQPFTNKTVVASFQTGSDVSTRQVIYAQGGGTNGLAILVANDSVFVTAWNQNNTTAVRGLPVNANDAVEVIFSFEDVDPGTGVDLRLDGYANGVNMPIRSGGTDLIDNTDALALRNHANAVIGNFNVDQFTTPEVNSNLGSSWDGFSGKVMEVFSFNGNLNETQRIIVENYLAAKYNGDISTSGNDYYAYSGSHSFDVAGIGRVSSTDFYTQTTSDSTITISNASNLGDGEYFIFGHNNGSVNSYTTSEAPSGMRRLNREWRITETGDIGTVTFSFDTLTIPATPVANAVYTLMVDTDGNFSSGATYIPLTLNGSAYEASNVDFSDGDYFTIGTFVPTVSFTEAASNDSETVSPVSINIDLNYPVSWDVTFDVNLTGGTATPTTDFTFTDDTYSITASNTSTTVDINVVNDSEIESDETVELTLSNFNLGQLGTNTVHTYTINDDDNFRKANFYRSDSTDTEDQTVQGIYVFLNAPDDTNPTEVYFRVESGSTAQNDSIDFYVQAVDTLVFVATDTVELIDINLIDDNINEFDETIIISLIGGSNTTIGDTTEFTFTIVDEDPVPDVQFTTTTKSGSESFQTVELAIELSEESGKDITVPYSVGIGGDATEDSDFQLLGSQIVIPAGSVTDSLQVIVIDDGIEEVPDEDFIIQLDAPDPTEANIGVNSSITYTILDNDGAGIDGPGGVGNLDAQIAMWLRADATINGFVNGNPVATWLDISNNNNDGFQATAGLQPTYLTNLMNNRPALVFDGVDDLIEVNDTDDINTGGPYDKKTIFIAFRTGSDVTSRQMLYEEGGGVRGLSMYIDGGLMYLGGWNEADDDGGATTPWPAANPPFTLNNSFPVSTNTNYFAVLQFDFDAESGFPGDVRGGLSSVDPVLLQEIAGAGRLFNHPDDIGIGGKNGGTVTHDDANGGNMAFEGNISEIFVTNFVFNEAQRRIIANYFSTKYDIDIGADDLYAYDLNHSYDLFGIGRVNASNVHNQARGTGAITISNPSDINNNEYLLVGHNNQPVNQWSSTDVPNDDSDNFRRVPRVWRVDETGDVGTISISIVNTQFIAPPAGFEENYVFLVDADGDFTSGAEIYQLTENGSRFEIDNIDLNGDAYFTVGIANGIIEFSEATSSALEDEGNILIPIQTNYIVGSDVTIDYAVTGGDASGNGVDYTLASGTATISSGSSLTNINVSIVNDVAVENTELVEITLSNPSSGISLGTIDLHTLSINDDDQPRKANFANSDSVNVEDILGAGGITLTVFLSEDDDANPTEVVWEVTGGTTATNSEDYVLPAIERDTLTFVAAGTDTVQTIFVPIIDDLLDEDDEILEVSLVGASNAALGDTTVFTLTIQDDDDAPDVSFTNAVAQGIENITAVQIPVSLSAASSKTVSVDYAVVGGDAVSGGIDYSIVEGTLDFAPGSTEENINITLFNDALQESDETIILELSGAVNANSISPNSQITFTILDDDSGLGPVGPGGVGNAAVAGVELAFWLDASQDVYNDAGTTLATDGQDVAQWNILAGQTGDATDYNGGNVPSFSQTVAAANNQSGISFDATLSESLTIADNDAVNTETNGYSLKSIFVVFQAPATLPTAGNRQMIYEQGGGGNGLNIYLEGNGVDADVKFGAWSSWTYGDVVIPNISAGEVVIGLFEMDQFNSELRAYVYGSTSLQVADTNTAIVIDDVLASHGGDIGIGSVNNSTRYSASVTLNGEGDYFDGLIFEIGQYNERVTNSFNRKVLLSYFEAKYGVPVTNFDIFNDANEVTFNSGLIGIGQDSTASRHYSAQSYEVVWVNSPSDVNDGEHLVFAHDGGAIGTLDGTGLSATYSPFVSRIQREWIAEESGDLGTVTFLVDTTVLGTPDHSDYVIIIDNDNDGDFSDDADGSFTFIRLTDRFGKYASSSSVDFNDGDIFTIGVADNAGIANGDWSNPNTWLLGEVPTADATVTVTGTSVINIDTDVTIENLTLNSGTTLNFNAGGFTLTINNTLTVDPAATFNAGDGTVNYAASNGSVCVEGLTYNNLIISGGGIKLLCGDITVQGNLTINNNPNLDTDVANSYDIFLEGNWVNAVSATYTFNSSQVVFQGSSLQTITKTGGTETFYDLVVNNGSDVSLGSNVQVNNTLTFTNGSILTNGNTLDIENNAVGAIIGANSSNYVVATSGGILQREVATGNTYSFPVGDASTYSPATFTYTSGTVTDLNASVTPSTHPSIDITGIFISRYWTISPVSGTANYDISYQYSDADFSGTPGPEEDEMIAVKYNSYLVAADGTYSIDNATNTVTWTGLTSFSDFTAGDEVALPVELVDFIAYQEDEVMLIEWSTASEIDNDYFEVYRSINGQSFDMIGTVKGNGTTDEFNEYLFEDISPVIGDNYYRLRQVDYNGDFDYSYIIKASFNLDNELNVIIYPNPVPVLDKILTVSIQSSDKEVSGEYTIYSLDGQKAISGQVTSRQFYIDIRELRSGMYYLNMDIGDQELISRFIKE